MGTGLKIVAAGCLVLGCASGGQPEGQSFIDPAPTGAAAGSDDDGTPEETSGTTSGGESSGGSESDVRFDVPETEPTSDGGCSPEADPCCGGIPPHELLDAFLDAYPPAAIPTTHDELGVFMPVADGHAMAWSDPNVGGELVDPDNGGVIEANIETGRGISRTQAEAAMEPGSVLLDTRDDPVIIEAISGDGNCFGHGWAWGSILFTAPDDSIREVVYLYIGHCAGDGDAENFFYSDEAVEVCAAPG